MDSDLYPLLILTTAGRRI